MQNNYLMNLSRELLSINYWFRLSKISRIVPALWSLQRLALSCRNAVERRSVFLVREKISIHPKW